MDDEIDFFLVEVGEVKLVWHEERNPENSTRTIAELESKLEEETQSKLELEGRLSSARSELEDKQKQTKELIEKTTAIYSITSTNGRECCDCYEA
jgi:CII-binding regulator of phage lambda lysogenization HflD